MPPVFLTGFMGTGKSTVGRALARRLGKTFVDADTEIERLEGMTVARIFAEKGEEVFRRTEREVIAALAQGDAVVALGGGAIVDDGNFRTMRESGPIVCLTASVEEILRRVGHDRRRPLLAGDDRVQRVRELLEARRSAYSRADFEIETTGLEVETVVDRIVAVLAVAGDSDAERRKDSE